MLFSHSSLREVSPGAQVTLPRLQEHERCLKSFHILQLPCALAPTSGVPCVANSCHLPQPRESGLPEDTDSMEGGLA